MMRLTTIANELWQQLLAPTRPAGGGKMRPAVMTAQSGDSTHLRRLRAHPKIKRTFVLKPPNLFMKIKSIQTSKRSLGPPQNRYVFGPKVNQSFPCSRFFYKRLINRESRDICRRNKLHSLSAEASKVGVQSPPASWSNLDLPAKGWQGHDLVI